MAHARNSRRARGSQRRRPPNNTVHRIFRSKSGKTELGDFAVHINPPPFPPSVTTQILQEKVIEVEQTFDLGVNTPTNLNLNQIQLRNAVKELLGGSTAGYTAVVESILYWCSSADISSEMTELITGKVQLRSGRLFRPARGGFGWPKNKRLMFTHASTSTDNFVSFQFSSATAQKDVCVLLHVKLKVQPLAKFQPGPTLRFINLVQSIHNPSFHKGPGFHYSPPLDNAMARLSTSSPHSLVAIDDICSEAECELTYPHVHRGVRVVN